MYLLGIESSCDDTSAAVICDGKIIANPIASQEIHANYGGVVPELASRAHQQHIVPVVQQALSTAGITTKDLSAIAVTYGPGLLGSLLVGTSFAKSLALALNIPLLAINHMQAHILAHFIHEDTMQPPPFPFLCLTISGGHTQLVKVTDYFTMELLGETLDDAVGEAFDKTAKILGFPYPGGPLIDQYAQLGTPRFIFSKPKVDPLAFSFSGLKTNILRFLEKNTQKDPHFIETHRNDICASVQHTIVAILMEKLQNAMAHTGIKHVAIAGGVAANSEIRKQLAALECTTYIPDLAYTTDNAAMIAMAGLLKFSTRDIAPMSMTAKARLSVEEK